MAVSKSRVRKLERLLRPAGQRVIVYAWSCMSEEQVSLEVRRHLGRAPCDDDIIILLRNWGDVACPDTPHSHHDGGPEGLQDFEDRRSHGEASMDVEHGEVWGPYSMRAEGGMIDDEPRRSVHAIEW